MQSESEYEQLLKKIRWNETIVRRTNARTTPRAGFIIIPNENAEPAPRGNFITVPGPEFRDNFVEVENGGGDLPETYENELTGHQLLDAVRRRAEALHLQRAVEEEFGMDPDSRLWAAIAAVDDYDTGMYPPSRPGPSS